MSTERIAYDFVKYAYGGEEHDHPPTDGSTYSLCIYDMEAYRAAFSEGKLSDPRHTLRKPSSMIDERKAPGS